VRIAHETAAQNLARQIAHETAARNLARQEVLRAKQHHLGLFDFYQRNSCDCLESAFKELKTTAQRTNRCWHCEKDKPIKQIKECLGCKSALYCSRECQLADYTEHKQKCNRIQEQLKDEMSTAECVD
jgi:hypothetical protein